MLNKSLDASRPGERAIGVADSAGMGVSGGNNPPRSQEEWERAARALLDEGQNFLAHDTCREGLKFYPNSHKLSVFGAIALSQTGAIDEARRLLKPVLDALLVDEAPFRALEASLSQAVAAAGRYDAEALRAMVGLAQSIEEVRGKALISTADSETYTSLARVFREAWAASGDRRDLDLCGELSLRAYRAGGDSRDGVDAATTAWLRGDAKTARELAEKVRDALLEVDDAHLPPAVRYRRLANLGQAQLLLDDGDGAVDAFHWAAGIEGAGYPPVVSALRKFKLLEDAGKSVPAELYQLVKPPRVVVCTGHPLDRPGENPHFPPELEASVRAEIARTLDEIDAQIGYSMAACGSDLLFIEAMLERGAEVNVVLPFALDDFIAAEVRYAGPRWEMRFRNALKLASTVTYATEERYLGHAMLYRFANQCLHGLATLRAGFLMTSPTLLAVWDMMPGSLVGGAAEFIDQWEDISALRIIDLDGLLQQFPDLAGDGPVLPSLDDAENPEEGQGRVIRSMMFCDIAGYSKLKEEHIPIFLDFLDLLNQRLSTAGLQPMAINTWGDAIFAVMDKASPMAEYALTLQEAVVWADEILSARLPHPLNLRISLHAGPVFEATDPICGRRNFYGSHINRAARLEPVTVIGHVYATQQFVAVLTAEQSALRSEAVNRGEGFEERFISEYVGQLSLAKDFGRQVVYHLRRRAEPAKTGIQMPETEAAPTEGPIEAELSATLDAVFDEIERPAAYEGAFVHESEAEEVPFSDEDLDELLEEVSEATADDADLPSSPPVATEKGLSEDDIALLLAEAAELPEEDAPAPPLSAEAGFSDSDIEALLEESAAEPPEEDAPVAPPLSAEAGFSDSDIEALLEESAAEPPEEDAPAPPLLAEAGFSDSDIEALLDESAAELPEEDAPAAPLSAEAGFSDSDIEALLEESSAELPEEDAPAPPLSAEAGFSDSDIEALLEESSAELPEEDAPAPPLSAETGFSDSDLAALLEESAVEPREEDAPAAAPDESAAEPLEGDTPAAASQPTDAPAPRGDNIESVLAAVARLIERADALAEPPGKVRAKPRPAPMDEPPPAAGPVDTDAAARLLGEKEMLFPGA